MKRRRTMAALLAAAAMAGALAFARAETTTGAAASDVPDVSGIAALTPMTRRLDAESDRMALGIAQMRLNASAGDSPRR